MIRFFCLLFVFCSLIGTQPSVLAQEEASAIIDKAIKAHGDTGKTDKMQGGIVKSKGTINLLGGITFMQDVSFHASGKFKDEMKLEINGQKLTQMTGYDGTNCWMTVNGMEVPLNDTIQKEIKEAASMMHIWRLSALKDKKYKLTSLGGMKVNGRSTVGVKVAAEGRRDLDLYFDKETGLLTKVERRAVDVMSGQEVNEERIILEYQDTDGRKAAKRVLVNRDGKQVLEAEVLEVKSVETFEDRVFTKP